MAFGFKQSEITGEFLSDTVCLNHFFLPQVKQFMVVWLPKPAGEDRIRIYDGLEGETRWANGMHLYLKSC